MFKFSLETVLKQRRILEDQAARMLAEVNLRIKTINQELLELESLREKKMQEHTTAFAKGLPISEMELARFQEIKLMHQIEVKKNLLSQAEQDKLIKEAELLKRVKDRRLLEKVREQHFQDWQRESVLNERKDLDEVAIIRAARLHKK